jgi:soluble lytic murein transglycosylase-like protein
MSLGLPRPARAPLASAVVFLLLLSAPVRADSPADQYLAARRGNPPPQGLTLAVAAQSPDTYRGMTLEIEGRLLGIARSSEGASLLVGVQNHGALLLTMSRVPSWLESGDRLRVLAAIGGAGEPDATQVGMPELLVVAVAAASDISAAELRWQAEAGTRAARERQRRGAERRVLAALAALPSAAAFTPSRTGLSPAVRTVYEAYRAAIRSFNKRLTDGEVDAITSAILLFSEQNDVDPRLVIALMIAESSFNPRVTSNKGAMGLGQLMPDEARKLGLTNPYDPVQNIAGSIYLLKGRLDKYSNGAARQDLTMRHIILALASYNAGMGAVKRYGGVPPYRETRNYVKKVERIYRQLCSGDVPS